MSEKSSLRHFSDRRRLRRREHLMGTNIKEKIPAKDRRVPVSARISVLPKTVARLSVAGKSFKMSRARLVAAILDWFAVQPELIQAAVVNRPIHPHRADFSGMVLQRLLDR
jgi:hypothetical protein